MSRLEIGLPPPDIKFRGMELYETGEGKYICYQVGIRQGKTRYTSRVCESLDEVRDFFCKGWLVKELLKENRHARKV